MAGCPAAPDPCGCRVPVQVVLALRLRMSPAPKTCALALLREFQGLAWVPLPAEPAEQSRKYDVPVADAVVPVVRTRPATRAAAPSRLVVVRPKGFIGAFPQMGGGERGAPIVKGNSADPGG